MPKGICSDEIRNLQVIAKFKKTKSMTVDAVCFYSGMVSSLLQMSVEIWDGDGAHYKYSYRHKSLNSNANARRFSIIFRE